MTKNTRNPKMKNLKFLKEPFSCYYKQFFKKLFSTNKTYIAWQDFARKLFSGFLDKK